MSRSLIAALCLTGSLAAQEPPQVLHGTWTASAGTAMVLRGAWSAQARTDIPRAAYGSWTLLNQQRAVVLQGTWSAELAAAGWKGSWSARTSTGRSYAGTFEAALPDAKGGTVMDMLQRSIKEQIAGSWRYGRFAGNWWLEG